MHDGGEVGVHPVVRLGDVADVLAGDPAPQDPEAFAPDGPLFVRMQDVGRAHLNPALSDSVDRLDSTWLGRNRLRLFPKDSVLIPKSGVSVNLNHRAKLATDAYVVSHLAVVVPDRTKLDPDYLFWWSVRYDPRAQVQVTSLPSLKLATLKDAGIRLLPLDEQRRIAGILNRAARIERLRARAAECLDGFALALFASMFGDPADNPMGWRTAPIGDACAVIGGGTPRRSEAAYFGGGIPWATPTDVTELADLHIGRTKETITETGLRKSSARLVPAGTVLLTSRATIGFTAIAARPMATNQGFANLICGDGLTPEYLAHWLVARRDLLIRLAGGTTFKEISKATLKKIPIPLPPMALQRDYARTLETARGVIRRAHAATQTATALTATLMDRLLDGNPAQ